MDAGTTRGALPERIVELMMVNAEFMRCGAPWVARGGEVAHPLQQLRDLKEKASAIRALADAVLEESERVFYATRDEYRAQSTGTRV
jgi:hypothetical protein